MSTPEIERLDGETVYRNARDLTAGERRLDGEELGLVTAAFDLADAESMIDGGQIVDAMSVAAFHLLRRFLERERQGGTGRPS